MFLIYDRDEARPKIVSEHKAVGLMQEEQVHHFPDTDSEAVRSWFLETGVELSPTRENGPFSRLIAETGYCTNGRVYPHETINRMFPCYELAKDAGYHGSRSCGEMTWLLQGTPGFEHLLEYEVFLSTVVANFPTVACANMLPIVLMVPRC